MSRILYSDKKGTYKLIDFNNSHNELLFRKYKAQENDYNIDIMFKGVLSLNIITAYKGIEIVVCDAVNGQTSKNYDFEKFIFKILDGVNISTYISAAAFGVFKNKLDYSITSLGDFMWSKENELIFWSHDDKDFKAMYNL